MTGTVVQINISRGGVPKTAISEALVNSLGIEGDGHAHPQFHGGPLRSLLLIASEALEQLVAAGFPVFPGALGENITMRGIDPHSMRPGQRYRIGEVIVETTSVRQPCDALSVYGTGIERAIYDQKVKAGDPASPLWAMSGFYCSVVVPGTIRTGDPIMLLEERA